MNHSSLPARPGSSFPSVGAQWLSRLVAIALLAVVVSGSAQTQTPDDQYLKVLSLVDRADTINEKKQGDLGKAKYVEAGRILQQLRQRYPTWNSKVVAFRLGYVTDKVIQLTQTNAPPVVVATSAAGAGQAKLIEAGAEPRQALRIEAKAGDKQSVTLTLKMEVDMMGTPMKMPAMKSPMDLTVTSVAANGDIAFEIISGETTVADDAGGDPAVAAAIKSSLGEAIGLKTTGTMSSRGVGKSDVQIPAGVSPQARQTLQQMNDSLDAVSLVLPEEAVGPGAKWESKRNFKAQGMSINQTVMYELVSIEGSVLTLKSKVTQTAPNQKVENPAMPGMKLDLTKYNGKGSGEITFDLAKVLPVAAKSDMKTDLEMGINVGGQKQSMPAKASVSMTLESQ